MHFLTFFVFLKNFFCRRCMCVISKSKRVRTLCKKWHLISNASEFSYKFVRCLRTIFKHNRNCWKKQNRITKTFSTCELNFNEQIDENVIVIKRWFDDNWIALMKFFDQRHDVLKFMIVDTISCSIVNFINLFDSIL